MAFTIYFTKESEEQLSHLRENKSSEAEYKAVSKAIRFLQENPKHPSLQSQPYHSLKGPKKEPVFESYAQQNSTPRRR